MQNISKKQKKIAINTNCKDLEIIALTLRAFFLNLFMIENCWSLVLTVSPSEVLGAMLVLWSQGCSFFTKARRKVRSYSDMQISSCQKSVKSLPLMNCNLQSSRVRNVRFVRKIRENSLKFIQCYPPTEF